eukprot:PhM_4_TR17001/c0_g1_i1/m.44499
MGWNNHHNLEYNDSPLYRLVLWYVGKDVKGKIKETASTAPLLAPPQSLSNVSSDSKPPQQVTNKLDDEIIISPHVFVEMVHFGYALGLGIIVGVSLVQQVAQAAGVMPVQGSKNRLYANVFVSFVIVIVCVWAVRIYMSARRRQQQQQQQRQQDVVVFWLRTVLVWMAFVDMLLIDWSFSGELGAANMMTVNLVPLCVCFGMFRQIVALLAIFMVYTVFRVYELTWGTPAQPLFYANGGDASSSPMFMFLWSIIIEGITYFFTIWSLSVMITALGYERRQMKMSLSVLCVASVEAQEMRFEQAKGFLDLERELTSPFPKHILWQYRQMCDLLITVRSFLPGSVGHKLVKSLDRESSKSSVSHKTCAIDTETVSSVILTCELVLCNNVGNDDDDDNGWFPSESCNSDSLDLGLALDSATRILADYGGVVFGYSNGVLLAGFYDTEASHVLAVRAALSLQRYLSSQHDLLSHIGIDSGCVLRGVVGQEGVRMFSELRGGPVNRAAFLCNLARHLGASDGVFVPKRIADELIKEAVSGMLVRTVCSYAQDTIVPSTKTGRFPDVGIGGAPTPCPRGRYVVCQVFDLIPQNIPRRELAAMRDYVSRYDLAIDTFVSLGSISDTLAFLDGIVNAYRHDVVSRRVLESIQRAFPNEKALWMVHTGG